MSLPPSGRPKDAILQEMRAMRQDDVAWRQGRVFSLVFSAGEDVAEVQREAYTLFLSENGLNPSAFPSLRRMESEVVGMAAGLLGGAPKAGDAHAVGSLTSGGTESLLLAVLSAREWAREHHPEIITHEMILPRSAHPAFEKAAHYFGVKIVYTPLQPDFRADPQATRAAITPNTILLAASAPAYPQGVVDPVAEIGALAQEFGLLLHVDACVGGFMLPFVRRLGYPVPDFDLSVPGVTSLSADLHKYGYTAKGASLILYRDPALRRRQFFVSTDWPGGIYPSPTLAGTRPGGAIAAAWAVLNYLGEDGYLRIAGEVMQAVGRLRQGIAAIPGLRVLGDPPMSVLAIGGEGLDVYEVGDELAARGWHLDRQQFPPSLHLTVNYAHVPVIEDFLRDLAAAAGAARRFSLRKLSNRMLVGLANALVKVLPEQQVSRLVERLSMAMGGGGLPKRSAAMYGMMGTLPNRGDLRALVTDLLDGMTRPEE